ncbi:MAG: class I SAM-dependent methyltransferase [Actinomycetota bacterium]
MDGFRRANLAWWNEAVEVHMASSLYRVDEFRAGGSSLKWLEIEELGDVSGRRMLHLQCHFGLDTLSWARRGARVTGVDFSQVAVARARELAAETGIGARFICSEISTLPEVLDEEFDIVFTSYGALYWLPDIHDWASIVARYLAPGGTFYIAELHPFGSVFDGDDPDVGEFRLKYPYFHSPEPLADDTPDYADPSAAFASKTTYGWTHPIGEVVSALIAAGLRIEFLHEFPFSVYHQLPFLAQDDDGLWRAPEGMTPMPLVFSIRASKE